MVVRECGICNTYSFKLADTCFMASHVDSLCKHSKCAWGKCSFLITGYRDYLYMYSIKIADWIFQVCIFANVCLLHLSISERDMLKSLTSRSVGLWRGWGMTDLTVLQGVLSLILMTTLAQWPLLLIVPVVSVFRIFPSQQ